MNPLRILGRMALLGAALCLSDALASEAQAGLGEFLLRHVGADLGSSSSAW